MSIRQFHLLFIAVSVILTAFFAAWSAGQYRAQDANYALAAAASLAAGAALAVYGAAFQRKTRRM